MNGRSMSSPKSPLSKKRLPPVSSNQSSQSDVCWRYERPSTSFDSPQRKVGGNTKQKSANQLLQTPVRIVKRHVSSPNLNSSKSQNLGQNNLSRFEKQLGIIPEVLEDKPVKKLDSSFDLSSEEFKFDLNDEEILDAVKKIDEIRMKKSSDSGGAMEEHMAKDFNFEDSFDDALLSSIPLDEISKQCSSKNVPVDIVFDLEQGLSQVRQNSPLKTKGIVGKTFERHVSLPSLKQNEKHQPVILKNSSKELLGK